MRRNKIYEKSLFHSAYNLPYDDASRAKIHRSSKGDLSILQRMGLVKNLAIHSGCVNTISWNETGQYLLSGSDDQHLVISDAYTHKVIEDFKTSHRANIFSAKFLPCIRDSRIVSCSGDGIIIFTDLMSAQPVYKPFNCHCGTAYEVATVPLDPHSFLTCGEDGTVRWYDLRTKESCNKAKCEEDVMIQCQRAVTAMSVNSRAPFEMAIGCSDSTVRLFDRRTLGTRCTGMNFRNAEPLCVFTVPSFKRAYRITSLCYSPEGSEILVSYSSDDLYLFSLKGAGSTQLKSKNQSALCMKGKMRLTCSTPTPVRRLRLRGDWSDTGPDARPERETGGRGDIAQARPTLHTPLMQHLTNVISRLLNDPATRRALTSGVDEADAAEGPQDGLADRASTSQGQPDGRSNDEDGNHSPERDEQNGPQVYEHEHPLQEYELFGDPGGSYDSPPGTSHNISVLSEEDNAIVECYETPFDVSNTPTPTAAEQQEMREYKLVPLSYNDRNEQNNGESSSNNEAVEESDDRDISATSHTDPGLTIDSSNVATSSSQLDHGEYNDTSGYDASTVQPESNAETLADNWDDVDAPTNESAAESGAAVRDEELNSWMDLREEYIESQETEPGVSLSYSHLGTNASEGETADGSHAGTTSASRSGIQSPNPSPEPLVIDEDRNSWFPTTSTTTTFSPSTALSGEPSYKPSNFTTVCSSASSVEPSSMINHTPLYTASSSREYSQGSMNDTPSTSANASCLAASSDSLSDPGSLFSDYESEEDEEDLRRELTSRIEKPGHCRNRHETPCPVIRQQYTGHRNARTMIKEATFWGTDYIMSGSDCGHVFVWDRSTAKVVMLLQADQHVVNCIQPHPTEPLLATAGIDHDVKLWAPQGEDSHFNQVFADEIVKRNALMLEETKDTITVPASFMIRMVACLNQIRREGRARTRRRTQDSQDD